MEPNDLEMPLLDQVEQKIEMLVAVTTYHRNLPLGSSRVLTAPLIGWHRSIFPALSTLPRPSLRSGDLEKMEVSY